MNEPFYAELPQVLATAAGEPPRDPVTGLTVKVGVIPDRLRDADPRAVLDELRMPEPLPREGYGAVAPRPRLTQVPAAGPSTTEPRGRGSIPRGELAR
jgi:hypothetical protein